MDTKAFTTLVLLGLAVPRATAAPACQDFAHNWAGLVNDVFVRGDEAYTVEDGGRIRHRDPTTGNWSFQTTPFEVQSQLRNLHFLGSEGWAVGENGWILHDATGSGNWAVLFQMPARFPALDGPYEDLYDVYFTTPSRGWVVGLRGIWRTTNAGVSWTPVQLLDRNGNRVTDTNIQHMEFYALDIWDATPVEQHMCVCPSFCPLPTNFLGLACAEPGIVYKTVNGGTWMEVFDVRDLCPCNGGTGFILPEQEILCEDPITGVPCGPEFAAYEPWDIEISRHPTQPLALMTGGAGVQIGLAFASSDWGCTWVQEPHECDNPGFYCPTQQDCLGTEPWEPPGKTDAFATLYGVGIFADNSALAAGYNGNRYRRDGGPPGQCWYDYSKFGNFFEFQDAVVFPMYGADADETTTTTGYIVGAGNHLLRTADGGVNYMEDGSQGDFRIRDVYFFDEMNGWMVSQHHRLAKTLDGGETWTTAAPIPTFMPLEGAYLNAVTFSADNLHGVAVGQVSTTGNKILWTANNGASPWNEPTTPGDRTSTPLLEVDWDGGTTGPDAFQVFWAVGPDGLVLRTTDGGANWTTVVPVLPGLSASQFDIDSVSFDVPGFGVFVGTRTDNNTGAAFLYDVPGDTWTNISPDVSPDTCTILTDVHVKGNFAYAVGTKDVGGTSQGLIVKAVGGVMMGQFTDVGGYDIPECTVGVNPTGAPSSPVEPLTEVEVVDASNVWVAGQCGRVFKFDGLTWAQHKSQTDAHVRGMSFISADVGYVAAWRDSNTQSCIVRYGGE